MLGELTPSDHSKAAAGSEGSQCQEQDQIMGGRHEERKRASTLSGERRPRGVCPPSPTLSAPNPGSGPGLVTGEHRIAFSMMCRIATGPTNRTQTHGLLHVGITGGFVFEMREGMGGRTKVRLQG
ncbi:hypothetical protein BHM03_00037025 [Ensete ventricosum]|nr:hypothetical protein BHM03_00037025 [Ensete ventricosum]